MPDPQDRSWTPWRAWQERGPHGPWHVDMGERGELYIGHLPSGAPDTDGAHLIGAAPELFEALDHVEAVLSIVMPRSHSKEYAETLQEVRAALAKARGEP